MKFNKFEVMHLGKHNRGVQHRIHLAGEQLHGKGPRGPSGHQAQCD